MGPKTVEQYLIEKLEELPEAIHHILYEHGDQVAVAKELLEAGNTSEACGALAEAAAAYSKIAAYLAYLEGYVDSMNDLPEEEADPSPPGFVVAEGFQKGVWVLPQFLPQFCQRESPEGHPPGAFFVLSV